MADPTYLHIGEWGGTPNGWPRMTTLPAVALWAHHSVTQRSDDPVQDFQLLDSIGKSRGHGGISYSYAISHGVIGEGQGQRRGAHTAGNGCGGSPWGWNPCSYGVVFVGNYDHDTLTEEDAQAFRWLREVLIYTGGLVPGVYPTGGHQDAPGNSTGCPGNNLEADLDRLRLPYAPPAPTPTPPPAPIKGLTVDYLLANTDSGKYTLCTANGETADIDDGFAHHLMDGGMPCVKVPGPYHGDLLLIRAAHRQ